MLETSISPRIISISPRIISIDQTRETLLTIRSSVRQIADKIHDIKYGATSDVKDGVEKSIPMGYEGIVELVRQVQSQLNSIDAELEPLHPTRIPQRSTS